MTSFFLEPDRFSHLTKDGNVTLLGFGSLVSEKSARASFQFQNFRYGTVTGFRRIFNRADWIKIDWGDARIVTGEVCSVAFAQDGTETATRVALMEVTADEGLNGFLHREATYNIIEVPYVDDNGNEGVALACGEISDEQMKIVWNESDCWYLKHCIGKISYLEHASSNPMPIVPDVQSTDGSLTTGDPSTWIPMAPGRQTRPYKLPDREFVYPAPGYLRLVYRAHCRGGLEENFLDTTLLMDRCTTLRAYLNANPLLRDWVTDPEIYSDRVSDRYG